MTRLFYFVLVILLAPLLYGFCREGIIYLSAVFTLDATKWFLLGGGLGLVVAALLIFATNGFINVLLHEFEHAVVAFFFSFRLPSKMVVIPAERSEVYVSPRGGCIVSLAPYYFPLFTVPLLLIKALAVLAFSLLHIPFPPLLAAVLDVLIGATFVFHLVCTLKEFRFYQDDIKKTGYVASVVGVLFMNFMFLILCIAVVTGTYAELLAYGKAALAATVDAYKAAWDLFVNRTLPALKDLVARIVGLFCPECTPAPAP